MISRKLDYLIALAKEGHFARAAASCNVSQPALSAGIHQLEQDLGIQIVKRGQRYRGLTEAGEMVLNWAQRAERECRQLRQHLRDSAGTSGGTLHLGALNSATPFVSIFTLPFQERFPEVNFQIRTGSPFEIQQGVEELTFDVAINFLEDKSKTYLRSHALYTQEYYVITRKKLGPFAGRKTVTWGELKTVPLCLFPAEKEIFSGEVYENLGKPGPGVPHLDTDNMFVLIDHVQSGRWASLLPKPVLFMVAGDATLEAIPLPRTSDAAAIGIAIPRREPSNRLAEAFFEMATSRRVLDQFRAFMEPTSAAVRSLKPHIPPNYSSALTIPPNLRQGKPIRSRGTTAQ